MKGILGRKLGMTQVFTDTGVLIPVTVIEATPNIVLQKKLQKNDGYEAVQLGFEEKREKLATKPHLGHVKKANTTAKRFIKEIRSSEMVQNYEVGAAVKVDVFKAGEYVDVSGYSKGKGFTGAIKRNNQAIGPASHGSGFHRGLGSLATIGRNNGVINKNRIMAGQEGHYNTTNQKLEIIKVDVENSYLLIKGNVPGPKRGLVVVTSTVKRTKKKDAVNLVDYSEKEDNVSLEAIQEIVNENEESIETSTNVPLMEESGVSAQEVQVAAEGGASDA